MANSPKILIVEDESEIRKFLKVALQSNNMQSVECDNARDVPAQIIGTRPDLIILDLGLPDKDGQELLQEIREWCKTPIIILSARFTEMEKVLALENGADDYLVKPFSTAELLARIKVALRHSNVGGDEGYLIQIGDLKVDLSTRQVTYCENEIKLTPIEYKLLTELGKNAGKVITHSQLLYAVWGKRANLDSSYLRIHIQHLREKIGDDPMNPKYIFTIPGIGYKTRGI